MPPPIIASLEFWRAGGSIARIFSSRPHRRSISKTFWRLYDNNACIKHWFQGNSIKQYNKTGYFLRTETNINNPKSLGLQKPANYLQAYLWEGVRANDQFLNCCADVDASSVSEDEHQAFTKPVPDHKGRNVAPPDFRKDRQTALAHELLKPKYQVYLPAMPYPSKLQKLTIHLHTSSYTIVTYGIAMAGGWL